MNGPVKILGHPIHPMLIVFPLGLLSTGVIFDLIARFTGNEGFYGVSYWMIAAGLVGGLVAAIFGFMDWLSIDGDTRAKGIGAYHGLGNLVIFVLFALSWWLRSGDPNRVPDGLAFTLSLLGFGLALVTGWLGGELVYRLGMAGSRRPRERSQLPDHRRVCPYPGIRAQETDRRPVRRLKEKFPTRQLESILRRHLPGRSGR